MYAECFDVLESGVILPKHLQRCAILPRCAIKRIFSNSMPLFSFDDLVNFASHRILKILIDFLLQGQSRALKDFNWISRDDLVFALYFFPVSFQLRSELEFQLAPKFRIVNSNYCQGKIAAFTIEMLILLVVAGVYIKPDHFQPYSPDLAAVSLKKHVGVLHVSWLPNFLFHDHVRVILDKVVSRRDYDKLFSANLLIQRSCACVYLFLECFFKPQLGFWPGLLFCIFHLYFLIIFLRCLSLLLGSLIIVLSLIHRSIDSRGCLFWFFVRRFFFHFGWFPELQNKVADLAHCLVLIYGSLL